MKLGKFVLASAAVAMVLGLLVVVPVHAADFTDWECKWFKGGEKNKGVLLTDDPGVVKVAERIDTYAFVQSYVAGPPGVFTSWLVQGNQTPMFMAQVLGDNPDPLDYVSYALVDPTMMVPGVEALLVSIRVQGKEKNGELTKGKVQTVGGSVIYSDPEPGVQYFVAQQVLKMKMVPQDKVPEAVKATLDTACGGCVTACEQE